MSTKSRFIHTGRYEPGDLVLVNNKKPGVIMAYWDSTVYDSASAEVLVDGSVSSYEIKALWPIDDED
jgi:hypothetical protein